MKNLDLQKTEYGLQADLKEAFDSNDNEKVVLAMRNFGAHIQQSILEEYQSMSNEMLHDRNVLMQRGVQQLTANETKYYNAVIAGSSFSGVEELLPPTVINRVFEDLTQSHPLLGHIDFVTVGAAVKWIYKNGNINLAWWGKLCSDIQEIADEGFDTLDLSLFKLSGFMPVCNAMLDLGPEWLDRYVRTVIAEGVSMTLEQGIVAGTGLEMPAGMMMDMSNFNSTTGYPVKAATALTDLKPATLGKAIMDPLTKDGTKVITEDGANGILLLVNPSDYWSIIFPATTPYVTAQGVYKYKVTPLPVTFVQSVAVPKGKMIAGKGSDYFMGVGSTRKFEVLKEIRAVQDETLYLTRMYGNGKPKDNDSFLVFDITGLSTELK